MCVCSLGYSGDSCQAHLLKTMQGPIVYGATGLCAALVVVAVMAALVRRKKRANKRFFKFINEIFCQTCWNENPCLARQTILVLAVQVL